MTTPDAEDASPSPEYGGEQDQDGNVEMADSKESQPSNDASSAQQQSSSAQKPASNAKDPLRPRRKKARRACFACQRAHLTCGDERPCQRCIKRGLQDACHDGVRKKAKYLHDAPNEALMPGIGGHYPHHINGGQNSVPGSVSIPNYQQNQSAGFNFHSQNAPQGQMGPPIQDSQNGGQQHNIANSVPQTSQASASQLQHFGGPLFDPSDPALFNFDIASLNFGNHYGALEFGMLGHMSSGAADTPPTDASAMNPLNQAASLFNPPITSGGYTDNHGVASSISIGSDGVLSEWNPQSRHNSIAQIHTPHNTPITTTLDSSFRQDGQSGVPHAFAIGAGPSSLASASPGSTGQDLGYENAPMSPALFIGSNQQSTQQPPFYSRQQRQQQQQQQESKPAITINSVQNQNASNPRKRRRDPSAIYDSVQQPYPYTKGFHRLIEYLRRRFPSAKTLRIAKALASIRPSFISCTRTLDSADLIFMEKCFQRQLWEYENFICAYGTPTIICRRTGEVVAVTKEFSILTGWRRDVLLGKEPNLNVNTGGTSGVASSGSQGGTNTPRIPAGTADGQADHAPGPQSVFVAELLDDDSVIKFYDDFAKLAFGDSRGSVQTQCKLLKYRTKEDVAALETGVNGADTKPEGNANGNAGAGFINGHHSISGEAGIGALGASEGKVTCMCSWTVTRDVFEVPMMIVMNFLPII